MICPNCKTESQEKSRFCGKCGASLLATPAGSNGYRVVSIIAIVIFLMIFLFSVVCAIFLFNRRATEQAKWQKVGETVKNEITNKPVVAPSLGIPQGFQQYNGLTYQIAYPDSWLKKTAINSQDPQNPKVSFVNLGETSEVSFTISTFVIPPNKDVSLEEMAQVAFADLEKKSSTKVMEKDSKTLNSNPAFEVRHQFVENGQNVTQTSLFVKTSSHAYVLQAFSSLDNASKYESIFETMRNSFKPI